MKNDSPDGEDDIPHGAMDTQAASTIMTIMHAARMARFDLLRAVCHLVRRLTKWTGLEDKLRKIIEYIHSSYGLRLTGFVGDSPEELSFVQHSDADFASDRADAKSTSGLILAFVGPWHFSISRPLKETNCSVTWHCRGRRVRGRSLHARSRSAGTGHM